MTRTHADQVTQLWGTLPGQPQEGAQGSDLLGSKHQGDVKGMFLGMVQAGDMNLGIVKLLGMIL